MTVFKQFVGWLRTFCAFIAILCIILLSGCGFYDVLGIDTHDYAAEPVVRQIETDGEVACSIREMVSIMFQNTPFLQEFDTPSQAAELYRNGILCFILSRNYAKYSANAELIEETQAAYPGYEITTVIPAVDFESTVYRYFGGTDSVDNTSTPLFMYLGRVDVYVSVGIGVNNQAEVIIESLYETENTYVCDFYNQMGEILSERYRLLLMKREDGSFYMRKLCVAE